MTTTLRADLAIVGGRIPSVLTGEVFAAEVAVRGDAIVGVLPAGSPIDAPDQIDARGQFVVPGFIDSHMHIESSFLTPAGFAALTLPCGTTTVLADPHEIVNVGGAAGVRWMAEALGGMPQTQLLAAPSCVPSLAGFETGGADLSPQDVAALLRLPGVVSLGEVMDYRAVVAGDSRMLETVRLAREAGAIVDGHCPGITGADLSAYLAAGIDSDHTKNPVAVAIEKARLGMQLQLQEKSISRELIDALMSLPLRPPFSLVTDDVAADAIVVHGHLDHLARRAVEAGLPPLEALRAITLVPAGRLRLYDRGSITPGRLADIVLLPDLAAFHPSLVLAGGRVVARDGVYVGPHPTPSGGSGGAAGATFRNSVKLPAPRLDDMRWPLDAPAGPVRLRAMRVNDRDTSTTEEVVEAAIVDGRVVLPAGVALLTVIHRHGRTSSRAFAPVVGLNVADGAVATTYAHDTHNLLVLGTTAESMVAAATAVVDAGGGVAVAREGNIAALLELPVAGLMSDAPVERVVEAVGSVRGALSDWGYRHANAFMSISTLSLAVSPHLKLTDRGLVDVERRAWAGAVVPGDEQPISPTGGIA
jgi:adenine deaminase